jgi:hypothetical protein
MRGTMSGERGGVAGLLDGTRDVRSRQGTAIGFNRRAAIAAYSARDQDKGEALCRDSRHATTLCSTIASDVLDPSPS